jgi:hypothetical protein
MFPYLLTLLAVESVFFCLLPESPQSSHCVLLSVHFGPAIIHMLRPNFSELLGPASQVTHSFNLRFPVNVSIIHPHLMIIKAGKYQWSGLFSHLEQVILQNDVTGLLFTNAQKRKCRVPG